MLASSGHTWVSGHGGPQTNSVCPISFILFDRSEADNAWASLFITMTMHCNAKLLLSLPNKSSHRSSCQIRGSNIDGPAEILMQYVFYLLSNVRPPIYSDHLSDHHSGGLDLALAARLFDIFVNPIQARMPDQIQFPQECLKDPFANCTLLVCF